MPKIDFRTYLAAGRDKCRSLWARLPLASWRRRLSFFFISWWQWLLAAFAALIFLYYPIGGWMINNLDRTTSYEINVVPSQSAAIEMMSFLIKREVSEKLWTPNLPFIFPSYFLDNMPNFQSGLMSSVAKVSAALAGRIDKPITDAPQPPLKSAAALLAYPGNIWMFSPQNKLTPAPSSTSQYRKARKKLIAYNRALRDGSEVFYKSPDDLAYFLRKISLDLQKSNLRLEDHIRENSSRLWDNGADDVFYYQQGKLYGYYLLLKALGYDYKDIIVTADVYPLWTKLLKALEDAAALDPAVIRNGEAASLTAPNHLYPLGYNTLKAALIAQKIGSRLQTQGK